MPRRPREYLLRYQEQTKNNLERAQEKLKQMHDMYEETHPSHAEWCASMVMAIEILITQMDDFRKNFM